MNAATVDVHLLPERLPSSGLVGQTVVIVDVLRASSTVVAALDAGCRAVVPCLEVAEARNTARRQPRGTLVVLGGERGGRRIDGFDLANSPSDYSVASVAQRTVIFTTTNGTRAMQCATAASRILIGCFANLSALAQALAACSRIAVVCAGTDGSVSWEDSLFAGALVERLRRVGIQPGNDTARLCWSAWCGVAGDRLDSEELTQLLRLGSGGRNVDAIGNAADISWVAVVDRTSMVPELHLDDWTIRPTGVD